MKNIAILALCFVFLLGISCKKKSETEKSSESTEITFSDGENASEKVSSKKIKDCEDFLDQFEEWSEDYIAFMSKFKDNPAGAVSSPEYAEMMQKASSWSQEWISISVSCGQNSSYEKRMEEIGDRMDKKIEELGFNK